MSKPFLVVMINIVGVRISFKMVRDKVDIKIMMRWFAEFLVCKTDITLAMVSFLVVVTIYMHRQDSARFVCVDGVL